MKGAISAHSGSVRSLAYLSPTRACWRRVSSVQAIVISVQLCNRTEAQPAELTQLVSNRALRDVANDVITDVSYAGPVMRGEILGGGAAALLARRGQARDCHVGWGRRCERNAG